jgi:hypothetical protein
MMHLVVEYRIAAPALLHDNVDGCDVLSDSILLATMA